MNVNRRAPGAALLIALALTTIHAQDQKIDTSVKAVVAAAGEYVTKYQRDMAYVLADELATQVVTGQDGERIGSRTTRAEIFLTYLPNEGTWIAVRDVREVDDAAVNDADDIGSLIRRAPLARLGAVIAEKNSRFNIGDVRRTFNEPTIGLLVASPVHHGRFKFDRVAVSRGAAPMVTLKFTERERPTLISGTFGEPVFTRGEFDVDAASGRIERTHMEMTLGPVRASLTTAYALDPKLNLWVPSVMSERYEQTAGTRQTITVETTYTHYRRFDTTVIIK